MTKSIDLSRAHIEKLRSLGLAVIKTEARAVEALSLRLNDDFATACGYMLECEGRIV